MDFVMKLSYLFYTKSNYEYLFVCAPLIVRWRFTMNKQTVHANRQISEIRWHKLFLWNSAKLKEGGGKNPVRNNDSKVIYNL